MRMTERGWLVAAAVAIACTAVPAAAAEPGGALGVSRAELVHRWDLNKDGTIDEAEAEVARAKMRRARLELQQKAATERPLVPDGLRNGVAGTGNDRAKGDDSPQDDGDARPQGDPLGEAFLPAKPKPPETAEREPADEPPNDDPRKRKRDLNAGRTKEQLLATPPSMPGGRAGGEPADENPVNGRTAGSGGIITGGARAGAPPLRPGYGASGPKVDFNAGRLPAGLPPAQGMRPQVGSAPFRSSLPGVGQSRTQGRGIAPRGTAARPGLSEPARQPLVPSSPARVSAEDIGLQ